MLLLLPANFGRIGGAGLPVADRPTEPAPRPRYVHVYVYVHVHVHVHVVEG
jgi:hypothetical protein